MAMILRNRHVLAVKNAARSAAFYCDAIGFRVGWDPGDNTWIFVERDGVTLMLGTCPDDVPAGATGCHGYFAYFEVDDVDPFHERLRSHADATLLSEPIDQAWGMREFGLKTPDGHRIMFGQAILAG